MMKTRTLLLTLLLVSSYLLPFTSNHCYAQCGIENTAFKSGEELNYDLYFNWKFIWMKVGTAEMDTKMTKFEGKDAWMSYLVTRGNSKLDKFFVMRYKPRTHLLPQGSHGRRPLLCRRDMV